ncbi:MAG: MFS transporter [Clostridiales bacterium]|nr:MFS transporter [Clostridiales bacterium]
MSMTTEEKRLNIHYSLILGAYWMIFAVSSIFIVPLLRLKGFDDSQIGILIAIRSISAITVSPLIATYSDRHPKRQLKYILMLLLIINIINTFIFQFCHMNYMGAILIFIILGATTNTMPPLHSSMAMKFNENGKRLVYSIGRGTGSISYAVISLILGQFVSSDNYSASLYIQIGLDIFSLICIMLFPKYKVSDIKEVNNIKSKNKNVKETEIVHSNIYLIRNYKNFTVFLIASVFVFVGYSMCNSFMIDIIMSRGGTNADMGISCFILGAAELPTAILFPKLKIRFGTKRLLEISAVFALVKMLFLYMTPNVLCVFFSQTIQMLGNGLYWPTSVFYVNEVISGKDQVKGQSLTNIASVNIGAVLGSVVSGKLLCYFNINSVILFGCICTFIGVIFMFIATRAKLQS